MIPFKIRYFNPSSPYANPLRNYIKNLDQRIKEVIEKGQINVLYFCGRSQGGKSVYAQYKIKQYDPKYITLFNIEGFYKLFDNYKRELGIDSTGIMKHPEKMIELMWRWILWEEPQLQINKSKFWDEKTQIVKEITSSWGFLKNQLGVTTPDCGEMPNSMYVNVTAKIDIKVFLKQHHILRKYYVYVPHKNYRTQKYFWGSAVESGIIPDLKTDNETEYFRMKHNNFFNDSLDKWKTNLRIEKQKREWWTRKGDKPLPLDVIKSLFQEGRIERERAYEETLKNGFDYERADLFLDSIRTEKS